MNNEIEQHSFSEQERDALYRVIYARRDMRHFTAGNVDEASLSRIFAAGHAAPSVGFMQPWRFIRITKLELRENLAKRNAFSRPINWVSASQSLCA